MQIQQARLHLLKRSLTLDNNRSQTTLDDEDVLLNTWNHFVDSPCK